MKLSAAVFTLLILLTGCSAVTVKEYAGQQPELIPEVFFTGRLSAHGIVKDSSGVVTRYFYADIEAGWDNGVGTIDERFTFDDGERDTRVWTLTPDDGGGYIGTAGDVVGPGHMTVAGNSMFLDYTLRVPWKDGTIDLRIDDRMYLVDPNTLINESRMTKFGIEVGQILLVIRREGGR